MNKSKLYAAVAAYGLACAILAYMAGYRAGKHGQYNADPPTNSLPIR